MWEADWIVFTAIFFLPFDGVLSWKSEPPASPCPTGCRSASFCCGGVRPSSLFVLLSGRRHATFPWARRPLRHTNRQECRRGSTHSAPVFHFHLSGQKRQSVLQPCHWNSASDARRKTRHVFHSCLRWLKHFLRWVIATAALMRLCWHEPPVTTVNPVCPCNKANYLYNFWWFSLVFLQLFFFLNNFSFHGSFFHRRNSTLEPGSFSGTVQVLTAGWGSKFSSYCNLPKDLELLRLGAAGLKDSHRSSAHLVSLHGLTSAVKDPDCFNCDIFSVLIRMQRWEDDWVQFSNLNLVI